MEIRRATKPWNNTRAETSYVRRNAVEAKEAACVWPREDPAETLCGKPQVDGLALCDEHVKIMHRGPSGTCAWPGCLQAAPFRSLCSYHMKRAVGLLGPYRA